MAIPWMRRVGALAATLAAALLLGACSSGTIESQLSPKRVVAFGDAMADLGQNGNKYTVNDGSASNWTQVVSVTFGLALTPSASGGTSYATGNARVVAKPDAAGNAATKTVKEQIDTFLAGNTFRADDLVLVNAGISDLIAETSALTAGQQTQAQLLTNVSAAGRDLGAQVRRMVNAGATHVVVVGPYNIGRSIWATDLKLNDFLADATNRFNEQFLVSVVDLGANVLYVDAALYFNLVTGSPGAFSYSNVTSVACSSVDPGPGIGTGANQVNSNLCTTSTLATGADASAWLFADRVYFTPRAHALFGQNAYNRIRDRW